MLCGNPARAFQTALSRTGLRTFASTARHGADVAVIGGGITGLTNAYALAKENHNVTLYEASPRLGGWISTRRFPVDKGEEVVFEEGPRTLRPKNEGFATAHLVQELGLGPETVFVSSRHPGLRNRYLYYPDHLVQLPPHDSPWDTLYSLWSEPLYKNILGSWILTESALGKRPRRLEDESVGDFIARRSRGTRALADRFASAVLHGIYAGDVWQLSMPSLLPGPWYMENITVPGMEKGQTLGIIDGYLRRWIDETMLMSKQQWHMFDDLNHAEWDPSFLQNLLQKPGMFYLKPGMGALVDALVEKLKTFSNVTIKLNTPIERLEYLREENKVATTTKSRGPEAVPSHHDYAISTIFAGKLATLFGEQSPQIIPPVHAVSVATVNLYYPNPHTRPSWVNGYGYLIPQAVPLDQNPERGLGVVFDSDATPAGEGQQGTKMTVMLGGHYWDGWSELPSEADCREMARSLLERHLGIREQPLLAHVKINRDCIPQYTVGHQARMRRAHFDLMRHFGGRLTVAGSSYHGVSINDCVNAGRLAPRRLGTTGLEMFADGDQIFELPRDEHPFTLRVDEVASED